MLVRAGAVWFAIMLIAILNGAARDVLLVPRLGDLVARALSCLTLASLIVAVTWCSLRWIHPASLGDAWTIGAMWLAMTLTFEFAAGHYLFHTEWSTLLADYNLLAGRLWVLVLVTTTIAPALVFRAGEIPVGDTEISSPVPGDTPRR
jgi:hypothetical protein